MSTDYLFKLPDLGEGMTEGEIVEWHVAVGDSVVEDAPMVEVMSDKATVTIGAPKAGWIRELRFAPGEVANVGDVLVVIGTLEPRDAAHSAADDDPGTARRLDQGPAATAVGDLRDVLPGAGYFQRPGAGKGGGAAGSDASGHGNQPAELGSYFEAKPLATPAVRALAKELGVDLRHVRPSGAGGRVQESDVRQHAPTSPGTLRAESPTRSARIASDPADIRRPFVGMRRRIADRLQASARSAVHFTFVEEVDVGALLARRDALEARAEQAGIKLTYLPFIVQAVTRALRAYPVLNSYLDEARNELVTRSALHIGVATATEAGLMVPVVRHAESLDLFSVAREIDRLAEGARAGSLRPDELSGSTFTVTSLGKLGGLLATPVLNYPEVGILGVHRIKEKPVVRHGEVVVGKVMMLSFSFDHRVIDGHVGASFAYAVIDALEHPESLS
ncbi:MAG: 2-oxo acid dehydrogenase subunit E2 [Myxococcales bacterium]|nr:2-oxo acid dehydrogenase subunit E2 [Myxococcales bacterium]MCB9629043.1 2-oxo acid dehydrogenase subunit E2 [Sandaracinaceae bacterium]